MTHPPDSAETTASPASASESASQEEPAPESRPHGPVGRAEALFEEVEAEIRDEARAMIREDWRPPLGDRGGE